MVRLLLVAAIGLAGVPGASAQSRSTFEALEVTSVSVVLIQSPSSVKEGVVVRTRHCSLEIAEGEQLLEAIVAGKSADAEVEYHANDYAGHLPPFKFLVRFERRGSEAILAAIPRVDPQSTGTKIIRFNGGYVRVAAEPLALLPVWAEKRRCGMDVTEMGTSR